jgi:hypothetical protein
MLNLLLLACSLLEQASHIDRIFRLRDQMGA